MHKYQYAVLSSKRYQYELERIGGKAAVLAAGLDDWFYGLWHGRLLGYTLAFLSIGAALVCFMLPRLLAFQRPHDEAAGRGR